MVHRDCQGTPQGGPLSPLLTKVLLDEVDNELERIFRELRALGASADVAASAMLLNMVLPIASYADCAVRVGGQKCNLR